MKHSIVTKTGDDGKTFLLGSVRVPKNHIKVKTYGECDELNSLIGLSRVNIQHEEIMSILQTIQYQIFELSAVLATPLENQTPESELKHTDLLNRFISFLENKIQVIEAQLPELKNFILPGGNLGSSFLHLARTVCRRVERTLLDLNELEKINTNFLIYFNRLSDLLFILARYENTLSGIPENIWKSGTKS